MVKIRKSYTDIAKNYTSNIGKLYIESILHSVETKIIQASRDLSDFNFRESIDINKKESSRMMASILKNSPELDALGISNANGDFIRVPENEQTRNVPRDVIKERAWFSNDTHSSNRIIYTEPHKDLFTGLSTVTVSAPLINSYGQFNGILAFDISLAEISKNIEKMTPPISGDIILLSNSGQVIADDIINSESDTDNSILNAFAILKKKDGVFHDEINHKWYFSYQFASSRWMLIYSINDNDMNYLVWSESQQVIYSFVISLLSFLIFGAYLKYLWEKKLANIIGHIKTGTPEGYNNLENILAHEIAQNSSQVKKLTDESMKDALTGALNRRSLDSDLVKKSGMGEEFSFALLDIDNFKKINDSYGHAVGDNVLKLVVSLCRSITEQYDCQVYRYGGEEFAIIFNNMNISQALSILQKCHEAVRNRTWREKGLKVTFSAGLSQWKDQEMKSFINHVDKMLYIAKKAGKDRTIHEEQ